MAETLICPRCGIACSVERDRGPVTIDYDFEGWRKQCVHMHVDGLTTCPEMLPTLHRMLSRAPRR